MWRLLGLRRCWFVGRGALGCLVPCWVGGAVPAVLGVLAGSLGFSCFRFGFVVWAALGGVRVFGPLFQRPLGTTAFLCLGGVPGVGLPCGVGGAVPACL